MLESKIDPYDPAYAASTPPADDAGDTARATPRLLQLWHTVLRWKWVIAGIIAACLVGGLIVTLLTTPQYTATARVEISREPINITNVQGLQNEDNDRNLEFYQTQYSLLRARSLAERVVRRLNLARRDDFFAAHNETPDDSTLFADTRPGAPTAAQRDARERKAVELLLDHVNIAPVRGSSLVDVSYTSGSPGLAVQIANAWTAQFIETSIDRRFASTADARKFLEARLADLRAKLEASERDLVSYAAQKGIVTLSATRNEEGLTQDERTLVENDLEALNAALARATADRVAAESRAGSANARGASASALGNQAIAQLREKRAEVAADYARMMVQFEPEYPAARALQQQVQALDASIAREETRVQNSIASEYREALQREQGLLARVNALKGEYGAQNRDSIQYNIYQREADTNRQLYDGLLQRYKEIGVAGVGANNIAIVDTAKVPDEPSAPSLPINLALALLAGLGIAGAATFALEQIDEGLREPGQVNRLLGVPLLGSVPDLAEDDTLAMLADPKSEVSEAYLTVRSNLAFSTDHGVPRSFMVTSTREAEGKSTTSLALATVLGRTGRRVLLVDADMRSPSVHAFVGGENKIGLSNFLAGENDWRQMLQPTPTKGLQIMPAGPTPPSAAELLSSDRMLMLVRQMAEHFDHIVIDSPPILGLADAPLLSRAVEGVVVVVEAEGVPARGINAALDRLRAGHAHLYGAVLTKFKNRQVGYGYGYGYGYGQTRDEAA